MQDARTFVVDLVCCSFGAAWKKPTRFITSVSSLRRLASFCSADHEHQPLRGGAPCGALWTKLACAYPPLADRVSHYARGSRLVRVVEDNVAAGVERPLELRRAHQRAGGEDGRGCGASPRPVRVLTDSQVTLGVLRKMHSAAYPLLRQARSVAAIHLSVGVSMILRWIPTEREPRGRPSRRRAVATQRDQDPPSAAVLVRDAGAPAAAERDVGPPPPAHLCCSSS